MRPKVPWLPSELQPGSVAERCPSCGQTAFIPWILRRDTQSKQVVRTWVCTECQVTEERPEPD